MPEQEENHINTVRALLIDQLRALRTAEPGQALEAELKRAKGVSDVAQAIVNSAKVEVDYLAATNQGDSSFLQIKDSTPAGTTRHDGPGNGITSITRHRLGG